MEPATLVVENEWLTAKECCALIQCCNQSFYRMVREGLIRRRNLPIHRKYWAEDVRRVAGFPTPK